MEAATSRSPSSSELADALVREFFLTPEGRMDPYPRYLRLRELAPVHRSSLGFWVTSRYEDCAAVLESPKFNKDYARQNDSRIGLQWREHVSLTDGARSMVNLDGAEHARLRRLVVKVFQRGAVESLRQTIRDMTNELLAPIAEAGRGEFLEELALPLALAVIGKMLGVPAGDLRSFPPLVRDLLVVFETRPTQEQLARADEAQLKFRGYFQDLVAEKRRRPQADLLSALATTEEGGDRLEDEELWMLGTLLFGAGFETTANQIGNSLLALVTHPAELQRLRADRSLLKSAPDELLRFDGTAQLTVRVAMEALAVGGSAVQEGETVLVLLGAANRDPARYARPDALDLTRSNVRPLTFGGGVHFCLGAALGKLELEVCLGALLDRFSSIELESQPRHRDRITLRGLESLRLACR